MKIDLEMVVSAMDSRDENVWYVDRKTGEVLVSYDLDEPEVVELNKQIENDPDRFLVIEPIDSRDGYLVMEDFVDTLPEGEARRSLFRAINGPKPFASFKHVLHDFPDERKAWFEFENERSLESAREFLRVNGIEFE